MSSIAATCATIAAILMSAQGGEVISFKGDCQQVKISRVFPKRVTVNAGGSKVRGLVITGGNVRWRSGSIVAPGGAFASGGSGYGVTLRGAVNVRLDGVLITDANRGIVMDNAKSITIADSRFLKLGADGIIANASQGVQIARNLFAEVLGKPTECSVANAVQLGLSQRDCLTLGGSWKDGYHPDAVQLRNGMKDVAIIGNVVEGATQGLSQMDSPADAPLERVRIEHNTILTDAGHKATLKKCIDCFIRWNTIRRPEGSTWKAVILPGSATVCGNITEATEPAC